MTNKPAFSDESLGYDLIDKRMDILRRIGTAGSISEAARTAGVSYKAAWQAVDTLTNLAGTPLLERTVGGSGGGGAVLTEAGQQLLRLAESLQTMRQRVLREYAANNGHAPLRIPGIGLRTSMRNQLPCTLLSMKSAGRAVCAVLQLPDGSTLRSKITKESAELLGLTVGVELLALAKATAVKVSGAEPAAAQTLNVFAGKVARVDRNAAGDEIVLALECGQHLVGFGAPGLRLKPGEMASALLEESAVVLAAID